MLRTVKLSSSDWLTSRLRMSTNGLTVSRELFPPPVFLHFTSPSSLAPGTRGPTTTPPTTATATNTSPTCSSDRRPVAGADATHVALDS